MSRAKLLALTLALVVASPVSAQAGRFRWQTGQTLTYRVEHTTSASETLDGKTTQTTSKVMALKRWQVLAVDATGVATVQKTVTALRLEITTPAGQTLLFDSTNAARSDPDLHAQASQFVGVPLERLRVDPAGRVVEVQECKQGSPSQFESNPPFALVLPAEGPRDGQVWERTYQITLDPPQGTGEKYAAVQRYQCKGDPGGPLTVTVSSRLTSPPESVLDRVPLLQQLPEGEIVFDGAAGLVRSVRLQIDQTLTGHQGEGSSYRFQSSYQEEYVGGR